MERRALETRAASYPHLRGLIAVPGGAALVVAALGNAGWGPFRHDAVVVTALAIAVALAHAIARRYETRFGRMTSTPCSRRRAVLAAVATVATVVGGSLLLRSDVAWSLALPVNPTAAALAAGFLVAHGLTVGVRAHHAVVWGALLAAGLLPVWGDVSLDAASNLGLAMTGAGAIVSGVLDHRLLTRSFGAPSLAIHPRDAGA